MSRRQRLGCANANCWASAPPQETPSTSTCVVAQRSSRRALRIASVDGRYGSHGVGEPPTPGHVEHDRLVAVERVNKRLHQLDVRANAIEQQQRRMLRLAGPNADPHRLAVNVSHVLICT